jgi:queuine tRNA-ribosyltransferase
MIQDKMQALEFTIHHRLDGAMARAGTIKTPHGTIETPAFIPVATRGAMRGLTTEQLVGAGAQSLLVNAYHLYLRPGHDIIDQAGGINSFMNWDKPTFSDSGGFQVMSLGVGFKKVIDMTGEVVVESAGQRSKKQRLAWVDDDGVRFKSHLDGSIHKFTPELSMQIQHGIGADITFAFDELTTLHHDYYYQVESLDKRTHPWAVRSLEEHQRLSAERTHRPPQALFAVIQGADHEDLRRRSSQYLGAMDFDGFGLGGALRKDKIGQIVRWMSEELPDNKPRHMLGISEPDDIFECIENGADTFDCVSPARVARNGALYTHRGRVNVTRVEFKSDFTPFDKDCDCLACQHYTSAYLHHLIKSDEMLGKTLATIHNEHFILRLVEDIRASIANDTFFDFKQKFLADYYSKK